MSGQSDAEIDKLILELEDLALAEGNALKSGSDSIKIKRNGKIMPLDKESKENLSKSLTSAFDEWLNQED